MTKHVAYALAKCGIKTSASLTPPQICRHVEPACNILPSTVSSSPTVPPQGIFTNLLAQKELQCPIG